MNSATDPHADTIHLGPIGRLGRLAAEHRGRVFVAWALIAVGLGILAPRVETALSGAGWQANGSQSVEAREQIDRNFAGAGNYALQVAVHSRGLVATAPEFRQTVARSQRVLRRDPAVGRVSPPQPGLSISPDGHTAVIRAGAAADPNAMVEAADRLETKLADAAGPGVAVNLTGASAMWSDFNHANRDAMLKSELISWPVTMAILVLAFGSLVAAGLPLMLTIVGLIASAGAALPRDAGLADLDLGDELRVDVRSRAGYRLRPLHRQSIPGRPLRPEARSRRGGGDDDGHGR